MKTIKLLTLFLSVSFLIASCSSDDDSGTNPPTNNPPSDNTGNYFPASENDYWNYDVEYTDSNDPNNNTTSSDSLYVASEANGIFTLGVNDNNLANGAMNGILVNGTLERTESTLVLDGSIAIPFPGFENSNIDFTDIVLYDLNGEDNTELSSASGSIEQEIDAGGSIGVVTVTIDYMISTHQINNNSSVMVNGSNYDMISTATSKVNMSISIPGPLGALYFIQNQDVYVSTNYFAENIGLVKSDTSIEYQVSDTFISLIEAAGGEIPFPTSGAALNVQEMTDYMVTVE